MTNALPDRVGWQDRRRIERYKPETYLNHAPFSAGNKLAQAA